VAIVDGGAVDGGAVVTLGDLLVGV
jgi:hypothetical protein